MTRSSLAVALFLLPLAGASVTVEVTPGGCITSAIEDVKSRRKSDERGEVVLSDGVYSLEKAIELDASASHIVIRAKNPGKAIVVGGVAARGRDFRPVTDKTILCRLPKCARGRALEYIPKGVLKTAFEKGRHTGRGQWFYRDWNNYVPEKGEKDFCYPDFPCLTIDLKRQELARWPNDREMFWIGETNLVEKGGNGKYARISTRTGREKKWNLDLQNVAAAGWIKKWRYLNCCTHVTAVDATRGEITLAEADVNTLFARAWFFNIPEELDEPGEWCFDGKSGKVLLFPPTGFGPDSLCAFGTTKDILFHITGDDILVRDINITAKVFHPVVVIEGHASGNEIRGCRFAGVGYDGMWIGGMHNAVRDCTFEDVVSMAIGVCGGDINTMIPAGNVVENNRIRHPEILCTTWAKGGIHVDGVGNHVAHNEVTDSVDGGLYYAGFDHLIEYNRIYDVCKEFDDVGSVYSPGGQRCYGNVFRFNDVSGSPGQGVVLYFDDTSSGHEAYGNILRDAGHNAILVGGGRDNYIHDNVIMGGFTGIEMDNRGLTWPAYLRHDEAGNRAAFVRKWNVTNSTSALVRKHPQLLDWYTNSLPLHSYAGNRFERNVIIDPAGYGSVMIAAQNKTIDSKFTLFRDNLICRTRGSQTGRDLILHPENVATNEYSAKTPRRLPIGECRIVDGTPEDPLDLGFVDLPPPAFDPWPYMGYAPQNWVDRTQLYALRRENFKPLNVRLWRRGDFKLKPGSLLYREAPGLRSIPFDKIGPQRNGK